MLRFLSRPQSEFTERTLVVSVPPSHRSEVLNRCRGVSTFDALSRLLGEARRSVDIFSPYVDPTFTHLLYSVPATVPVRVVTTAREGRTPGPNPVLERCTMERNLQVRYLLQRRHKAQMFQMHAKLVCADARSAYVGSANLTDTSLHYNLELGLLTAHEGEIKTLETLFNYVWENLGVPARRL